MIREIIMPQYSITMEEGTIFEWKVREGDFVRKGQIILVIETDKTTMDVEAEYDGYIRNIMYGDGDSVKVTKTIAYLSDSMEEKIDEGNKKDREVSGAANTGESKLKKESENERETAKGERVLISPAAKRLAEDNKIDISVIKGTGPRGRITKEDVEKIIGSGVKQEELLTVKEAPNFRKIIAGRMSESMAAIPHYYVTMKIDATDMVKYKEKTKKKISYSAILLKAAAAAIEGYPVYRSYYEDEKIHTYGKTNIGFAVDLNDRLMVPVVKNVVRKSIEDIEGDVSALTKKCRHGDISTEEMKDACFTISSLGNLGVDNFTAIISKNQSGILAVGRIKDETIVIEGGIKVRKMMSVTLSSDHRLIDGSQAAKFLGAFKRYIEESFK